MKIRFNKFEKVAGLFVGIAALSCVVGLAVIAIKQGWFSHKIKFQTELETADGVHAGTVVQISGLRVGQVTEVDLQDDKVLVRFEVLERFKSKIRSDSHVQMFRPFILADKVLEVSAGSESATELAADSKIPVFSTSDIMDLLSGKKMGAALASLDKLADSLKIAGEAFADPQRTHSIVQMIDRLNPLVQNLNTAATEVTKLAGMVNKGLPEFSKEVPDLGRQLGQLVNNLSTLIAEVDKLTPAIGVVAPELPRTTKRAVEALDEVVITLKAMQRSFLLRGNVEDIRKEENQRRPANTSEP